MGIVEGRLLLAGVNYVTDIVKAKESLEHVVMVSSVRDNDYHNFEIFTDHQFRINRDLFITEYMEKYQPGYVYQKGDIQVELEKELRKAGSTKHSAALWDALLTVRYFMNNEEPYLKYMEIAHIVKFASKEKLAEIEREYLERTPVSEEKLAAYESFLTNAPRPIKQKDDNFAEQIKILEAAKEEKKREKAGLKEINSINHQIKHYEKERKQLERQLSYETYQFEKDAAKLKDEYDRYVYNNLLVIKGVHEILAGTADKDLRLTVDMFSTHYAAEDSQKSAPENAVAEPVPVPERSHERVIFFCPSCGKTHRIDNTAKKETCTSCKTALVNTGYPVYAWQLRLTKEKEYLKSCWAAGDFTLSGPAPVPEEKPAASSASADSAPLPASGTSDCVFCYKCGTRLPADSVFCIKCGAKQPIEFFDN